MPKIKWSFFRLLKLSSSKSILQDHCELLNALSLYVDCALRHTFHGWKGRLGARSTPTRLKCRSIASVRFIGFENCEFGLRWTENCESNPSCPLESYLARVAWVDKQSKCLPIFRKNCKLLCSSLVHRLSYVNAELQAIGLILFLKV